MQILGDINNNVSLFVRKQLRDWRQEAGDRKHEIGGRRQDAGRRRQEAGDWRQETVSRKQAAKKQENQVITFPDSGFRSLLFINYWIALFLAITLVYSDLTTNPYFLFLFSR